MNQVALIAKILSQTQILKRVGAPIRGGELMSRAMWNSNKALTL